MRELPVDFNWGGFQHHRVAREGMVAMYRRRRIGGEAEHYEVIRIVVRPATEIAGKVIGEREGYPRSEEWGTRGWTYGDSEDAWEKFRELLAGVSQTVTGWRRLHGGY